MSTPKIAELAAMTDEQLMDIFGFKAKLEDAKEKLAEMAKLDGKAREYAEERIENMLTPNIYTSDMGWIVEDAKRHAKKKSGQEEYCDCKPSCL